MSNSITEHKNGFKRVFEFHEAWDKRSTDPKKDYGIHCAEMRFYLHGEKGAIQFILHTNWMLKQNRNNDISQQEIYPFKYWRKPLPVDLGYHSYTPQYEGQTILMKCPILDGKPCYYDGSGLAANDVFEALIEEGLDGVWAALENRYQVQFENGAEIE